MPLLASALGAAAGTIDVQLDERWCSSYAAGVPDDRGEFYDGSGAVHPLFPVAAEWALVIAARVEGSGLSSDEVRRGVHVGHHLVLARPVTYPARLTVTASLGAVGRRRAGATQEIRFVATDGDGSVVWTTRMTSLFLGVDLVGEPASLPVDTPGRLDDLPALDDAAASLATRTSTVRTIDAHVYSECARIWNPIHTEVVAAQRAGLAAPILHGTATLARCVSLASDMAGVPITSVREIAGRFAAQVDLGSTFDVRLLSHDGGIVRFDAVLPDGRTAIAGGALAV